MTRDYENKGYRESTLGGWGACSYGGNDYDRKKIFISDTAKDIFEIENSSRFYCVGDFEGGKIYHDTLSENHDLYYVEHSLMSANEMEKYLENKMN